LGQRPPIDQQCGQTWLTTFAEAGRFYSAYHQLPALIIPTWNDYEEGTEIETGIDNCVNVKASIKDEKLTWTITGSENTIDHYTILSTSISMDKCRRSPSGINRSQAYRSSSAT